VLRAILCNWGKEKKRSTPAGFEPALPKEMPELYYWIIAGHRVNHSAKVSDALVIAE
jgi:hypothetical protein